MIVIVIVLLSDQLYSAGSDSDIEQLSKIFKLMGTPSEDKWPGVTALPSFVEFEPCAPMNLGEIFNGSEEDAVSRHALRALLPMLVFDPNQRASASQVRACVCSFD